MSASKMVNIAYALHTVLYGASTIIHDVVVHVMHMIMYR